MKKRLFSVLVIFLCFFSAKANGDDDFERRKAMQNKWLNNIKNYSEIAGSEEFNKITSFLVKNSVLGAPHKFGVRALECIKKRSLGVVFVPVFKEDIECSCDWEEFYQSGVAVEFFPEDNILAINTRIEFSPLAKALALAREGYMAFEIIGTNCNQVGCSSYIDFVQKDAQVFQNKLMDFLGGKAYRRLVYAEAKKINQVINENLEGCFIPAPSNYNKRLEAVFGKAQSEEEKSFWQTSLWINAVFISIEKNPGGDIVEQKTKFLKTLFNR